MKKILSLFALIAISFSSPTQATQPDLDGLFEGMGGHFRALPNDDARRTFLKTPMEVPNEDFEWPTQLVRDIPTKITSVCDYVGKDTLDSLKSRRWTPESRQEYHFDGFRPLAFAVACARLELVKEFASVVDDWNSPDYDSWGFRQPYSLAHVVLDPYNLSFRGPLEKSVDMVRFLGRQGVDFTLIRSTSHYTNPPLASGDPRGTHENWRIQVLRGAALEILTANFSEQREGWSSYTFRGMPFFYPTGSSFKLHQNAVDRAEKAIALYNGLDPRFLEELEQRERMFKVNEQVLGFRQVEQFKKVYDSAQWIQAAFRRHQVRQQAETTAALQEMEHAQAALAQQIAEMVTAENSIKAEIERMKERHPVLTAQE